MDLSSQVINAILWLVLLSVIITLTGAWISITAGKKVHGWSNLVASVFTTLMALYTFYTFYRIKLQDVSIDYNYIVLGLVVWYALLFFIGQPWLVKKYLQHKKK